MAAVIQIKRRTGTAGLPPTLAAGELGYNAPTVAAQVGGDQLTVGDGTNVRVLVSAARQLELTGNQTIAAGAQKTIAVNDLKLTGGANNEILATDGTGNLRWTSAPTGGITAVSTDGTMSGNGNTVPLTNLSLRDAREISLETVAGGGTTITVTPASFDGTADALMTGFEITVLDGGVY